jgi:hypothetical protein
MRIAYPYTVHVSDQCALEADDTCGNSPLRRPMVGYDGVIKDRVQHKPGAAITTAHVSYDSDHVGRGFARTTKKVARKKNTALRTLP